MKNKFYRLLVVTFAFVLFILSFSMNVLACNSPSQHDKKETRSVSVGREWIDRRVHPTTYRYVHVTSKKWICGYADNQPSQGVYLRKGQCAYWADSKRGKSVSISYSLGKYKNVSLGSVGVSVPIGKAVSTTTSWPTNKASKAGYYKVYAHKYYKIETATLQYKTKDKNGKTVWKVAKKPTTISKKYLAAKAVIKKQK